MTLVLLQLLERFGPVELQAAIEEAFRKRCSASTSLRASRWRNDEKPVRPCRQSASRSPNTYEQKMFSCKLHRLDTYDTLTELHNDER